MKKLFILSAICIAFQLNAAAQKARLGAAAGVNFSNYTTKFDGISVSGKSRIGITAGLMGDIPLGKSFSLQPAVNFVQYGTLVESVSADYTERDEVKVNCIEVPVNCVYNIPAGKGRVYIGAGPVITFHLSGKRKSYDSYNGEKEKEFLFGSDENADMKSTNIGANFIAGYVLPVGLFFSLNYNLGLTNLEPGDSNDESTKSHYFGIKIGYLLKR